jgi:hypothetical protein
MIYLVKGNEYLVCQLWLMISRQNGNIHLLMTEEPSRFTHPWICIEFLCLFFFFDSLLEFVKNKYGCKQAEPSEAECLLLWPLLGQIKWAWAQLGDIKVPSRYLLMIFKDDVLLGTGQIPKTNWYFVFVHYISHHSMTFPTTPLNSQAFMLDWSCSH